jgi:hypothetical protein
MYGVGTKTVEGSAIFSLNPSGLLASSSVRALNCAWTRTLSYPINYTIGKDNSVFALAGRVLI